MRRKIVKQGIGGCTIYLPKKWVEARNLKPGDEIKIQEKDGKLELDSETSDFKKEISIKLDEEYPSVTRVIITNLYRSGYDLIRVKYFHPETFATIKKTVAEHTLGFQIVKKAKNSCVIESLTEPATQKMERIIGRQFFIVKEILNLLDVDEDSESVEEYLDEIKKYDNFSKRILNKRGYQEVGLFYTFLTLLTHSTRYLLFMNESKDSVKGKLNAAKEAFEELHQLYMTKKNEHFYNLHKMENKQRKIYLGHLKNENSDSFIYFFIRNIYLASSPLLDYSSLHAK